MAAKSNSLVNTSNASIAHSVQLCEAQLVAAAKRGHHAAFGELFARHSQRVFRTALRITRNREDAEDAAQDSFLNALVHLDSFDGRSSFSTWLTRIAINSALMKLRKNRACLEVSMDEPAHGCEDFAPYDHPDSRPNPEEHFSERQRQRIVTGAVSKLRPALRQAIEIRQLQGSSLKETARTLRISLAAAKSRLFHAKIALRQMPGLRAMGRRVCQAA